MACTFFSTWPVVRREVNNAWSVDSLITVDTADELLIKLKDIDISKVALTINNSVPSTISKVYKSDDLVKIEKTKISSSQIIYEFESLSEQLIVFSEIYYPSGWEVYIDDVKSEYFDLNYTLRGMVIPSGVHKIKFHFSPKIVKTGINIRIITIIITFSIIALMIYRRNKWV